MKTERRRLVWWLCSLAILSGMGCQPGAEAPQPAPEALSRAEALRHLREGVSADDAAWLRQATQAQLAGCQIEGHNGTRLFTPDGSAHYRALWTRDFQYMVHNAPDLLEGPAVKAAIEYLLGGQRADGCMPDRVNAAGKAVYSPGPEDRPLADHALDNGPFMALLVADYAEHFEDLDFFRRSEPALRKGLDFMRRAENGLVFNDPANPQCPYGFTDTVIKTGHLLFTSLLYYDACQRMHALAARTGTGEPEIYQQRADLIRQNLKLLWDEETGMFWAADQDGREIDVWGSALAVDLEVVSADQAARIVDYLTSNAERIFKRGQVRHLPAPVTWPKTFVPVKPSTYQNGAYWATPLAWVLPAIARHDATFASGLLSDVIADFRADGINECINDDYRNVPEYVASATNVYGVVRAPSGR